VLTVCSEVTDVVVGRAAPQLLRDLSLREGERFGRGRDRERARRVLRGRGPTTCPFAAVYLREGDELVLAASARPLHRGRPSVTGSPSGSRRTPYDDDVWRVRRCRRRRRAGARAARGVAVTAGPWADPVTQAVTLPLRPPTASRPRRASCSRASRPAGRLDDGYRSFLGLVAQQVSVAVRNAQAYDQERRRAAALAELDRAKTQFFTNVSHEFRTPLTLMLGPLADALADQRERLPARQRERLSTAHRNAGRLLTLVNELLDFSRLEAGRASGDVQALDLAAFTSELASAFRAAVERGGLELVVDCPPLPRAVAPRPGRLGEGRRQPAVQRLQVHLRRFHPGDAAQRRRGVRLVVADTGVGIAQEDLGRLFERFRGCRAAARAATRGRGIGLALVREVVRLAGGDVTVEQRGGSRDDVHRRAARGRRSRRPRRRRGSHLPVRRSRAEQALQWGRSRASPRRARAAAPPRDARLPDARVLVADDNADMRDYVGRCWRSRAGRWRPSRTARRRWRPRAGASPTCS
jgi:signal transduction histidine kinase